jgi:hypothetical protein
MERDACQEPPEVAGSFQHKFLVRGMYEEAAIGRLNDVLGIDAALEFLTNARAG